MISEFLEGEDDARVGSLKLRCNRSMPLDNTHAPRNVPPPFLNGDLKRGMNSECNYPEIIIRTPDLMISSPLLHLLSK
jgi:hypothetical protein